MHKKPLKQIREEYGEITEEEFIMDIEQEEQITTNLGYIRRKQ